MSWEILALTTAVMYGMHDVLIKYAAKKENYIAFSWAYQVISTVMFFALFVREFSVPSTVLPWIVALAGGASWAITSLAYFKSYELTDVSMRAPLGKVSLLLILLMSIIFLGEILTLQKLIGTIFIFIGVIVLVVKNGKIEFSKGIKITFISTFFASIAIIIDKIALHYFIPAIYGFFAYLLPSIFLTPLAVRNRKDIKNIFLRSKTVLFTTVILGAVGYFAMLSAFKIMDVSNVVPIVELSVIVSVFGGFLLHKEKEFRKRLIGAIIMILGSIFILSPGLL